MARRFGVERARRGSGMTMGFGATTGGGAGFVTTGAATIGAVAMIVRGGGFGLGCSTGGGGGITAGAILGSGRGRGGDGFGGAGGGDAAISRTTGSLTRCSGFFGFAGGLLRSSLGGVGVQPPKTITPLHLLGVSVVWAGTCAEGCCAAVFDDPTAPVPEKSWSGKRMTKRSPPPAAGAPGARADWQHPPGLLSPDRCCRVISSPASAALNASSKTAQGGETRIEGSRPDKAQVSDRIADALQAFASIIKPKP
jgi:hypothetical protein